MARTNSQRRLQATTIVAMLVTLSAQTSACYRSVSLRPDQIPRLSGMPSPQVLAYGRDTTIIAETRTTVITADGTTAEVKNQPELTLTLTSGRILRFEPPVQSSFISPEELTIAGSNLPDTRLRLDEIRGASASYQDLGATMLLTVLLVLLGLAAVGGVVALTSN